MPCVPASRRCARPIADAAKGARAGTGQRHNPPHLVTAPFPLRARYAKAGIMKRWIVANVLGALALAGAHKGLQAQDTVPRPSGGWVRGLSATGRRPRARPGRVRQGHSDRHGRVDLQPARHLARQGAAGGSPRCRAARFHPYRIAHVDAARIARGGPVSHRGGRCRENRGPLWRPAHPAGHLGQ
jgi:hypothetical protein